MQHQLVVKSKELMDEREQLSRVTEDARTLPGLTAANASLGAKNVELAEINASLSKDLRAVRQELAAFKQTHGAEALEEVRGLATRHAEEVKRLEATVCDQMELLMYHSQRADTKVRGGAQAELVRHRASG